MAARNSRRWEAIEVPRQTTEPTATVTDVVSLILRLPLGVLLVWSGIQRFLTMPTVDQAPQLPHAVSLLPADAVPILIQLLPYGELLAGLLLGLGFLGRFGAALSMVCLVALGLLFGWSDPAAPFSPRLIYMSVAASVLLLGSGMLSLDFVLFGQRKSAR